MTDPEGLYTLTQMRLNDRRAEAIRQRLMDQITPAPGVVPAILEQAAALASALAARARGLAGRHGQLSSA